MYIENLKLANFKNYAEVEVDLCSNINCFVGNNGVGKTNLLDGLYYLSFCKSFFNPQDVQNIRHEEEFFAIHGRYADSEEGDRTKISCVVKRGQGKQMKVNGKVCKTFAEHIGKVPLVMVSPIDQNIITGGSEVRRKFMDGVISQTNKEYLQQLMQYQKALDQRNKLLKQMAEDRYFEAEMLELWDVQLVKYGEEIVRGRQAFLKDFVPLFDEYYHWIAKDKDHSEIVYETQVGEGDYMSLLQAAHSKDMAAQYTTVGVHKDDLEMLLSGYAVKRFGSQGQQKTFVLALKLAQFQYIYNVCGVKPILLLDDVFDKLDMERVKQLVELVGSDRFGQVMLTDTQPGRVEGIFEAMPELEHKIFEVINGEVRYEG